MKMYRGINPREILKKEKDDFFFRVKYIKDNWGAHSQIIYSGINLTDDEKENHLLLKTEDEIRHEYFALHNELFNLGAIASKQYGYIFPDSEENKQYEINLISGENNISNKNKYDSKDMIKRIISLEKELMKIINLTIPTTDL